jgi:hypothetical protein
MVSWIIKVYNRWDSETTYISERERTTVCFHVPFCHYQIKHYLKFSKESLPVKVHNGTKKHLASSPSPYSAISNKTKKPKGRWAAPFDFCFFLNLIK